MILLDTDHLSVYTDERDRRHEPLNRRLERRRRLVSPAIVTPAQLLEIEP
jgi:hypothetical protein